PVRLTGQSTRAHFTRPARPAAMARGGCKGCATRRPQSHPYFSSTNAPCVLAWLAFRTPRIRGRPAGLAAVVASRPVQPLAGLLVVDFSRQTPGPFATRELLRLGARVVRVEPPDGDPLQAAAPGWYETLNAGKESVLCDLKSQEGLALAQALV